MSLTPGNRSPFEQYIGRWSRKVSPLLLAKLNSPQACDGWISAAAAGDAADMVSVHFAAGTDTLELNASFNAESFYRANGYTPIRETTQFLADGTAMGAALMSKRLASEA